MSQLSIAQRTEPAQQRRISKRVRHACHLLITGECSTVKAAAEKANLSRTHLSRTLQEPHVQLFVEREIRKNIGAAQMRAGSVLAKLMDEGKSEHVRRDCAQYFNELAGYVVQKNAAPAVHIHNSMVVSPGYVIDLSEPEEAEGVSANQRRVEADSAGNPTLIDLSPAGPTPTLPTIRTRGGR